MKSDGVTAEDFAQAVGRLRAILGPPRGRDPMPRSPYGGLFGAGWRRLNGERDALEGRQTPLLAELNAGRTAATQPVAAMAEPETGDLKPVTPMSIGDAAVQPAKVGGWLDVAGSSSAPSHIPTSTPDVDARQLRDLKELLIRAEGNRPDVYLDTLNIPTVGIGHRVRPEDHLKLHEVITDQRRDELFQKDIAPALSAARNQAAQAGVTDPGFIAPLASVNFQLGAGWNKEFKNTWALIQKGDYAGAAQEVARSKWARQTPSRVAAFQEALRALPPKAPPNN